MLMAASVARGRHPGLIVIEPTSELAWIRCAEVALSRTVTEEVPTNVCVLILYATVPGTVSEIGPRLVEADTDPGTAENAAITAPAFDVNVAVADPSELAVTSPASARAVTGPDSEVSVIPPAPADTDTDVADGTCTVYATPQTSSTGHV
jgi:hypothetical protein